MDPITGFLLNQAVSGAGRKIGNFLFGTSAERALDKVVQQALLDAGDAVSQLGNRRDHFVACVKELLQSDALLQGWLRRPRGLAPAPQSSTYRLAEMFRTQAAGVLDLSDGYDIDVASCLDTFANEFAIRLAEGLCAVAVEEGDLLSIAHFARMTLFEDELFRRADFETGQLTRIEALLSEDHQRATSTAATFLAVTIREATGERTWSTARRTMVIGRAASCDVIIADDFVSKEQAAIIASAQGLMLHHLGETNPTRVFRDGVETLLEPPNDEYSLRRGDEIRIGRVFIDLQFVDSATLVGLKTTRAW